MTGNEQVSGLLQCGRRDSTQGLPGIVDGADDEWLVGNAQWLIVPVVSAGPARRPGPVRSAA